MLFLLKHITTMYCDREKENNHIAGEERVLLLVAMYYTYIVHPENSVTRVYSVKCWSFELQPPRPPRSVSCHVKLLVNINALLRHEIQFWYPSRYLHAFVHTFAGSRLCIGIFVTPPLFSVQFLRRRLFYHILLSFLIYLLACRHHLISTSMHPSSIYSTFSETPIILQFSLKKRKVFVVIITITFPFFDVLPLLHSLSLSFCFV